MGLIDRARASAELAATRARESLEEAQLRRALAEARRAGDAERVRDLEARLTALAHSTEPRGHEHADD